jgi:hypothetical protein
MWSAVRKNHYGAIKEVGGVTQRCDARAIAEGVKLRCNSRANNTRSDNADVEISGRCHRD